MLQYAKETSFHDYAMLAFLADTGCRAGALCRLTIHDLFLEDCLAIVDEKSGELEEDEIVDFTEETAEAIAEWLEVRPYWLHEFMFASRTGLPLNRHRLHNMMRAIAHKVGAKKPWHAHAWRHAVGRDFADAGASVSVIQGKLNHKKPDMAVIYINQARKEVKEITGKVSPVQMLGGD